MTVNTSSTISAGSAKRTRRSLARVVLASVGVALAAQAAIVEPAAADLFEVHPEIAVQPQYQLVGVAAKVTATFTKTVSGSYYNAIYDATTNFLVAKCQGTVCTGWPVESAAGKHDYIAVEKTNAAPFFPFASWEKKSYPQSITWREKLVLNTSAPAPMEGEAVTLTATSAIGSSPYFIQIYDLTNGTRIRVCNFGSTCSVSQTNSSDGTRTYVAAVGPLSDKVPPANAQATSNQLSVSWLAIPA